MFDRPVSAAGVVALIAEDQRQLERKYHPGDVYGLQVILCGLAQRAQEAGSAADVREVFIERRRLHRATRRVGAGGYLMVPVFWPTVRSIRLWMGKLPD